MKDCNTKLNEAKERADQRAKRTSAEQINVLDGRLGKGVGATKERVKLTKEK